MAESRQLQPTNRKQNNWSGDEFDEPRPIKQAVPTKGPMPSTVITRENNRSIELKGGFEKGGEL